MNEKERRGFGILDARSGRPVPLAMQELWLGGTVLPVGARLMVRHVFRSQARQPLEVVYAFGLPRDAAMRRFRIEGENFSVESELKPVETARRDYEKGMESGRLSSLAQQYGDGLVNLNVGNIRPGESVSVFLELAAGVSVTDRGYRFRFPFTLAPGYHARAIAAETPDGEGEMELPEEIFGDLLLPRWRRDGTGLHRVGFDLSLWSPGPDPEVSSPSHPLSCRRGPGGDMRVKLATAGEVPDRDLVLDLRHEAREAKVFTGVDLAGRGRFAALLPSECFGRVVENPARVVFLIDHSGSMNGRPFKEAKQAVLSCIGKLKPDDRFGVVFFESATTVWPEGLAAVDEALCESARRFVEGMDVAGGTELSRGIDAAVRLLPEGGDILLLTDAQVFETRKIITRAASRGVRIHCLGIGSANGDRFLASLARKTGGASHFATPRERVDEAALKLFGRIGRQVAEGLEVRLAGAEDGKIAPTPESQVWEDGPLLVFGAFAPLPGVGLELAWEGGSMRLPLDLPAGEDAAAGENPRPEAGFSCLGETLKLIQGARITTDLESEFPGGRKQRRGAKDQRPDMLSVAMEYGLANPAMSLVAVVKRAGDRPGEDALTQVTPVGLPQDLGFDSYFQGAVRFPRFLRSRSARLCHHVGLSEDRVSLNSPVPPDYPNIVKYRMGPGAGIGQPDSLGSDLLEADGGMPGRDLEERVARTLLAMVMLHIHEREGFEEISELARRMKDFVEAAAKEPELAGRQDEIRSALEMAAAGGKAPHGDIRRFKTVLVELDLDARYCWNKLSMLKQEGKGG